MYYDGSKLLSLLDLNKKKPEIYISTANRSAGKTVFFSKFLVNRFIKKSEKFCLLYRFNYELVGCAESFFKEIGHLFFNGYQLKSKSCAKGVYHELFLNDESCGYAIAINNADTIKRISQMFSDVSWILFDEFQSETNHYCNDEVRKFISLHTSIARGGGKQVRYLPVIMIGNLISMLNPYYTAMHISERLECDTKYLRGNGYVLEQGFNESSANENMNSQFNIAFNDDNYICSHSQNVYLNDSTAMIERPNTHGRYMCTIKYGNYIFGISEHRAEGIIFCGCNPDYSFPLKICSKTSDMDVNFVSIKTNQSMLDCLRWYFNHGCMRFKNLKCKQAILDTLSY